MVAEWSPQCVFFIACKNDGGDKEEVTERLLLLERERERASRQTSVIDSNSQLHN